jgi:hypothetical protein
MFVKNYLWPLKICMLIYILTKLFFENPYKKFNRQELLKNYYFLVTKFFGDNPFAFSKTWHNKFIYIRILEFVYALSTGESNQVYKNHCSLLPSRHIDKKRKKIFLIY